ncbi:MAG: 3'(2'),5'-bisphosphate nucleotidase [Kiritimatiellia bacterium]
MNLDTSLQAALAAVSKAAALCEIARASLVTAESAEKSDRSPVTIADLACQISVVSALQAATPGVPVVGEEDSSLLQTPGELTARLQSLLLRCGLPADLPTLRSTLDRAGHAGGNRGAFWTLDPIDGTKGFLRGEQYAVALALIVDGRVELGVLGCPRMPARGMAAGGSLFRAVRGKGCLEIPLGGGEAKPALVQMTADTRQANLCESVESGHTSHGMAARITEQLGIRAAPFRMDSQCKYAAVARGDATLYLRLPSKPGYREKIWDHAAGSILVEEAGGKVTDTRGQPLDFGRGRELSDNLGVVVSNGKIHAMVVDAVRAVTGV